MLMCIEIGVDILCDEGVSFINGVRVRHQK